MRFWSPLRKSSSAFSEYQSVDVYHLAGRREPRQEKRPTNDKKRVVRDERKYERMRGEIRV
uniref:Fgenesh protein 103 n=1 Tax=Beta vulgaris TaxID=161934 RepID=Q1ZY10_BETVU|nr:Fgenesh protein 103 [Beta vulgaris]